VKFLSDVGRSTTDFLEYAGGLTELGAETGGFVLRMRIRFAETLNQCHLLGVQSTIIVLLTSLFTGMVFSLESAQQAVTYGFDNLVGSAVAYTTARELGPMLSAVVVAGRVGAAIAAEIGSMVVTEQVDALRMCAADPIDFLLVPRFLASMVMTTVLIVWAGVVAFVAAGATAYVAFDVPVQTFCDMSLVDWGDLTTGLAKCVAYGAAIPVVSGYCGLSTFGGSEGVGWATTRAVVNSSLAIIVLNAFISTAGLLVFGAK